MTLANRLERLEAKLRPAAGLTAPVFSIALDDGTGLPFEITYGSDTWVQAPDEPLAALTDRARLEALRTFKPRTKDEPLFLVAQRGIAASE